MWSLLTMIEKFECLVCGKKDFPENLVLVRVRDKKTGNIRDMKHVHGACWDEHKQWVQNQMHGKNPKYFVMGGFKG
jgi:hypothetical protein